VHASPWFILGAGSIGCLCAAYLSRAGHAVTLILRDAEATGAFHRAGGIRLHRPDGTREILHCAAISPDQSGESEAVPRISRVLVCTKAHQTLDAIAALRPLLDDRPLLVLLQNGMGVREHIQPLLPEAVIAQAITTEGAWRYNAFEVVHAGLGQTLLGNSGAAERDETIAASLHCELDIQADAALVKRQWLKLAVNCVINPLTTLLECRNGELLNRPDMPSQVHHLCLELHAVAKACGQQLPLDQLRQTVFDVMRSTASNQSSMWQDLQRRRLTEIDFINGYVVQQGKIHAIDCPAHAALVNAIKQKEIDLGCH